MSGFNTVSALTEQIFATSISENHNIYFKRDDLIHPIVSGNKWRKLKYHISLAQEQGQNQLVTFGGAYSNHLIAVACAGAVHGLKTTCFLRGDELEVDSNFYLKLATLYGMELIPTNREDYRNDKIKLFDNHFSKNPLAYFIPEGGAGFEGEKGVAEMIEELPFEPDYLIHASATATTASGILNGMHRNGFVNTKLLCISVLKNVEEQHAKLSSLHLSQNFEVVGGYECGGYAKTNVELMDFIKLFIQETGILIDPIYTGKALFALKSLCSNGTIPKNKNIVFLHTGGMLGLLSEKMLGDFRT
jgi:1-aminocyclopropane-1-carboxylate deaminase